jgi:hypothetical protein
MAREQPTTVYTEVQIDEDSISLTLISESGSNGPVIEDTERFTFDELQSLSGEHNTLSLSRESVNALESGAVQASLSEILQNEGDTVEGDVLIDDNPVHYRSDDTRVVVEEVTASSADEWQIEGHRTVADANPSYPADDTVILGHYEAVPVPKTYAFPESRLVETEPSGTTCTPAWNDN